MFHHLNWPFAKFNIHPFLPIYRVNCVVVFCVAQIMTGDDTEYRERASAHLFACDKYETRKNYALNWLKLNEYVSCKITLLIVTRVWLLPLLFLVNSQKAHCSYKGNNMQTYAPLLFCGCKGS